MLQLQHLTTEIKTNPIGVDERSPHFGWQLTSERNNVLQKTYRVSVKTAGEIVWDSGETKTEQSVFIPYSGEQLKPFTLYRWSVEVSDHSGESARAEATFETGHMDEPWLAQWICAQTKFDDDAKEPTYFFRKAFTLKGKPARARIYVSALGCYSLLIGGKQIGEDYFTPGYTDYLRHVQYQVYDVTNALSAGENTLLCELAGGWYTGRLGLSTKGNRYGKKRAIILELRMEYEDGSVETVCSDGSFLYTTDGPRRFAGFFDGEVYDATCEGEEKWEFIPCALYRGRTPCIVPDIGERTVRHEQIKPISTQLREDGIYFDFGKNFAGFVRLEIDAPEKTRITVSHAEILDTTGALYTENLRSAKAQLVYISKGGVQQYEPRFTYMGFRYIRIEGLSEKQIISVTAYELYADVSITGEFSCDNDLINQLQKNILTTQKANFIDIPTDCPQRDERVGWTGDLAIYSGAAAFNMGIGRFHRKWMRDLRSEQQRAGGNIPFVIPTGNVRWMRITPSPIWGDACTIVPWDAYQSTGDICFLEENYESMKRWMAFMQRITALGKLPFSKRRYVYEGFSFGDWVAPDTTMKEQIRRGKWIATAYLANSAQILAKTARILNKEKDSIRYEALRAAIVRSFCAAFLDAQGQIKNGFQSAYATALYYDILPREARKLAAEDLEQDVIANGYRLTTGFPSTLHLPFALLDHGKTDTAFQLLLQEGCPSWLYPVKRGATSIWERWDALREDGTVNVDPVGKTNMVSFSHYAYGAIGQFLYERIGGLTANEPGYRRFTIAPTVGGGIHQARVACHSPYGMIESKWCIEDRLFQLSVLVPPNTRATVHTPDGREVEVGSGKHDFSCALGCRSLPNDENN
jgi:alpha-L-rhamnosidase